MGSSATASPAAEGAEPHRLGEHCIQVELQNDDPRSVCGVFLRGGETAVGRSEPCQPSPLHPHPLGWLRPRLEAFLPSHLLHSAGWKVEEEMLGVLSKCLPALGNLKTLK